MEKKELYYVKETAPMGYMKALRILFIIGGVFSLFTTFYAFTQNGADLPFLINAAQTVVIVLIVVGLFKYSWWMGPVLLLCHWVAQCGLNVWDVIEDGDILGNESTENYVSIAVKAALLVITWLYFKRRRPLYKPYDGQIPADALAAAAQAAQPLKQANTYNTYSSGQPVQTQTYMPQQAQQAQPTQAGAHVTKLQQAYSHFTPSTVGTLFPGGISQADNAVVSLANLLGVDLSSSGYETYFKLLKAYADIVIARVVNKKGLDEVISTVRQGNPEVLRTDADAQMAESFFELNYGNATFAVVDMAALTEVKSRMLNTYGKSGADAISQPSYQPLTQAAPAEPQPAPAPAPVFTSPAPQPVSQPAEPAPAAPVWTAPAVVLEPAAPAAPALTEPELPRTEIPAPAVLPDLTEPVLAEPVLDPVLPELKEPELAEPAVAERPRFCANCGAPLKEGDLFCTNCGKRL